MVRPGSFGWITCLGCVVSLLTTTSRAQAPATIWDREILPQPFDKQPFRQIAIPDWRRIATNTTEIPQTDMVKFPHGGMLCLLGPYGDFFIDVLAEILTEFPDVNAFSFDGLHYGGVCYCEHCRKNYRADTSSEIPNADLNDVEFRKYQHWADRRMEDLVRRMQTRLKGPAVKVQPQSADQQVPGHIRFKNAPVVTDYPAIMTQQYGKGRVVYFAAGLDASYYLYSYPYQRLALKHAIIWAANEAPPIQVTAPMCVHSTIMRQSTETGSRLIVHLFNDLNTTAHHALPIDDVPLREETVPIHDIQIAFNADYAVTRVTQQPEGKELPLTKTADGVTVTVPKLEIHTMVVVELQEPQVGTALRKRQYSARAE